MCLTVFYILWSSIEKRYKLNNGVGGWGALTSSGQHTECVQSCKQLRINSSISKLNNSIVRSNDENNYNSPIYEKRKVHQFIVDCSKSTTGLFFGIFVVLLTIISLITYFIYRAGVNPKISIKISKITEVTLLCLSLAILISIYITFKRAKFGYRAVFKMDYNETLIIVGLCGIYLFCFYSIIAIVGQGVEFIHPLALSIQILAILEATFHSYVIVNALKMYSKDTQTKLNKPGRSLVTLLILVDVSMWLSETFSVKKYDMNGTQLEYYDIIFWSIVSSISSPLAIFFRFHSSVCLSDIWKTLYEGGY